MHPWAYTNKITSGKPEYDITKQYKQEKHFKSIKFKIQSENILTPDEMQKVQFLKKRIQGKYVFIHSQMRKSLKLCCHTSNL